MKTKKSSLRNDIPIGILKENINTLAGPLADLYNEIFHLGEYPKEWKIETTIIIPKKNNPKNVSETRNISITPALSKLCERILLTFLENQILSKISHFQFGGRKGTGISDLIAILLDKISEKIDRGGVAIFTSIDFSKAFNNIDHNKLLDDLVALGAEGWLIRVLESYLDGRMMQVKVGDEMSDLFHMKGGSPQGSLLGVMLFISYVNDICCLQKEDPTLSIFQFVDDTYILELIDENDLAIFDEGLKVAYAYKTNHVLEQILELSTRKGMMTNEKKTKFMIFRSGKLNDICTEIRIGEKTLNKAESSMRVLGVIISNDLSTDEHVWTLLRNARSRISLLKSIKDNGVPTYN
jgi:hypothetical protein